MSTTDELRRFAQALGADAPRSAAALAGLAELLESDPEVGALVSDDVPLIGVRILAGLHELVLTGCAPELGAVFSSPTVPANLPAVIRATVLANRRAVRQAVGRHVQQHTPDRVAALVRGLAMTGVDRVRLLEIGACAGLTLQPDRYLVTGDGWSWGDPRSRVRLTTTGPRPRARIVGRRGCDLDPVDPADAARVLRLHSFLPPELVSAHQLLDDGIAIAASEPLPIDRASAATWLSRRLAEPAQAGVHTVVWHSLVWHLLTPGEQQAIHAVLDEAAERMPLTRIGWEPIRHSGGRPVLQLHQLS